MKKSLFIIATIFCMQVNAQSKLKMGIVNQFGFSTIYGSSMAAMEMKADLPTYSLKPNYGIGVKSQFALTEKFNFNIQITYQQKGAKFDKGLYNYTPQFKLNYADVSIGVAYRTKELIKQSKLEIGVAASYSRLINATQTNAIESYNVMKDIQMNDFGSSLNIGLVIPRLNADECQVKLFASPSFKTVFSGVLSENGLTGKNVVFGIQFAYLFGKNTNK